MVWDIKSWMNQKSDFNPTKTHPKNVFKHTKNTHTHYIFPVPLHFPCKCPFKIHPQKTATEPQN